MEVNTGRCIQLNPWRPIWTRIEQCNKKSAPFGECGQTCGSLMCVAVWENIENRKYPNPRHCASVLCIVYVDIVEALEHKKSIYGASIPDSMVGWRRSEMLSMTIFLLVVVIIPFVFSCCVSIGMHCCDREIECCLMLLPLLSHPIACLFWIYIAESHCWI